jgi:hypothetical protein
MAFELEMLFSVHLEYFMALWYILWSLGIFLPVFGILFQEKCGIPVRIHIGNKKSFFQSALTHNKITKVTIFIVH